MAGILSKGLKLSYSTSGTTSYTELLNLQEVPDLGGSRDSVEVTTLADEAHQYINGLLDYGDSIDFVFLHEPTQFKTLQGLQGSINWKVTIPDGELGADGSACTFSGECSVRLNGIGTNDALKYTLSIKPNSTMEWA